MTEPRILVPMTIFLGEKVKIKGTALLSPEGLEGVIDEDEKYTPELLRKIVETGNAKKATLKIELEEATPTS